jgi:hypothetical protein
MFDYSDYTNIKSFYNYLIEKIYDDNHDLYKNLSDEQKKVCINIEKRVIIITQNNKSRIIFRDIFKKFFPDIKIRTDNIMTIIREFIKININKKSDQNFINELKSIKNNYVNKFIKSQTTKTNYVINFNAIIIGCPESTDIDVIVIVDDNYDIENININHIDIITQLEHKCIYILDKTKNIDINIINIKNKKVTKSQKGSIKTIQGIIYYTQHLHMKKEYMIDINPPDKFKIEDRIIPPINFILFNLDIFCGKDKAIELRDKKIFAINSNEKDKVTFIIDNNIMDIIINNLVDINDKNKDYIKALFVKLSTIILIDNDMSENTEYYTKKGIAFLLNKIYADTYDYSIYYLFRGNIGIYKKEFLKIIFDEYIKYATTYIENFDFIWEKIDINVDTPVKYIDKTIQMLFWKNPISPTIDFIDYFDKISLDTNIEKHFVIQSSDEKIHNFDKISEFKSKASFVNQRSPEWFELRKLYPPSNIIKDNKYMNYPRTKNWINELYHLICGSIGEQYVMFNIDWENIFKGYKFIVIGMLIDYDKKYSISPDGFLINFETGDIIPVEIKCIRNEKNLFSKTIMRELKMAIEQLKTIKCIISRCNKGLIVFMYINDSDKTFCEYTMIEL